MHSPRSTTTDPHRRQPLFTCISKNRTREMSSDIIIQLLWGLFGVNKSMKNVVFLDCNQHSGKCLHPSTRRPTNNPSRKVYSNFLAQTSQNNIAIDLMELNSVKNATEVVDEIHNKLKKMTQFGVALNYDCKMAAEIIRLVKL